MEKRLKVGKVFLILEGKENYKYPVMLVENDLKYLSPSKNRGNKYNIKITKAEDRKEEAKMEYLPLISSDKSLL